MIATSINLGTNTDARDAFMPRNLGLSLLTVVLLAPMLSGCSLKTYAINMVGDALAEGDSVYETDNDIEFVGDALPFCLKLTVSLLNESPERRVILLSFCRGCVLYLFANVE